MLVARRTGMAVGKGPLEAAARRLEVILVQCETARVVLVSHDLRLREAASLERLRVVGTERAVDPALQIRQTYGELVDGEEELEDLVDEVQR